MSNLMRCILCIGFFFPFSESYAQNSQYTTHQEAGMLTYGPLFQDLGFTLQTFHGVKLQDKLSLGLALGVDKYRADGEENIWVVPLAPRLVFDIPMRAYKLCLATDIGYGFDWLNKKEANDQKRVSYGGGLMLQPTVGFKFAMGENHFWSISFGYKYQGFQKVEETKPWGQPNADYTQRMLVNYKLQRLVAKIGWGF